MCFIRPLTVKKITGKRVLLDNKIEAFYEKKVGKIKIGDKVIVYGNLILEKLDSRHSGKRVTLS